MEITAEQILRKHIPDPVNQAEINDDINIIKAMEEYAAVKLKNHSDLSDVSNLFKPCTNCKYLRKIVSNGVTVDMWGCDKSGMYLTNPDKFSCQSHTNDC